MDSFHVPETGQEIADIEATVFDRAFEQIFIPIDPGLEYRIRWAMYAAIKTSSCARDSDGDFYLQPDEVNGSALRGLMYEHGNDVHAVLVHLAENIGHHSGLKMLQALALQTSYTRWANDVGNVLRVKNEALPAEFESSIEQAADIIDSEQFGHCLRSPQHFVEASMPEDKPLARAGKTVPGSPDEAHLSDTKSDLSKTVLRSTRQCHSFLSDNPIMKHRSQLGSDGSGHLNAHDIQDIHVFVFWLTHVAAALRNKLAQVYADRSDTSHVNIARRQERAIVSGLFITFMQHRFARAFDELRNKGDQKQSAVQQEYDESVFKATAHRLANLAEDLGKKVHEFEQHEEANLVVQMRDLLEDLGQSLPRIQQYNRQGKHLSNTVEATKPDRVEEALHSFSDYSASILQIGRVNPVGNVQISAIVTCPCSAELNYDTHSINAFVVPAAQVEKPWTQVQHYHVSQTVELSGSAQAVVSPQAPLPLNAAFSNNAPACRHTQETVRAASIRKMHLVAYLEQLSESVPLEQLTECLVPRFVIINDARDSDNVEDPNICYMIVSEEEKQSLIGLPGVCVEPLDSHVLQMLQNVQYPGLPDGSLYHLRSSPQENEPLTPASRDPHNHVFPSSPWPASPEGEHEEIDEYEVAGSY